MLTKFFIHRPIFAAVLSIGIIIIGLVTLRTLPVAQYPEIAPPTVRVTASYPGASAKILASTVAQPIEEQVNGTEGMLYMSSTSTNNGEYILTVTFEVGTDLDMAQVLVQNRVSQAEALLPETVQRIGLTVEKQSTNILMFISITSPEDHYDALYLSNYATLRIKDELSRLEGVGSVQVFGAGDYSMRIWLDPNQLKTRGLTTSDVIEAIREQNIQVAAGQIGQSPTSGKTDFQYTINVQGRLEETKEFEQIVIKALPGNRMIRVKDIARVELGAKVYNSTSQTAGKDSTAIGVFLQPGANALETAQRIKDRLGELEKAFPPGLVYEIPFDTTIFVKASIDEVIKTLFIAVILVFFTVLVFLQNWRATLIPAATIPVSLIGTFAAMAALGVSINMLSLFGLVLAIGVVVDDAIVVVENVSRNINESGLQPKEATIKAMQEVSGPIIATTLVLLAVFVPTAFLGGITGQLYRQFALTIATATIFSSINALTLSPALSAILLKPSTGNPNFFTRGFNWMFNGVQSTYQRILSTILRRGIVMGIVFIVLTGSAFIGFDSRPKGFVPSEDQGWAIYSIQLPDAASLQRTTAVVEKINQRLATMPGINTWVGVSGYSILDGALVPNAATIWTVFEPYDERLPAGLTQEAIVGQMWGAVADIQEALIFAFTPPPIMGLGTAGGFEMQVQDRNNLGLFTLQQKANEISGGAFAHPELQMAFTTFRADVPQLQAHVDRAQVKSLGVPMSNVFDTLQANLGSFYVNDFNKFGRTYQVRVQADAPHRSNIDDIQQLEVRNNQGKMVPLGAVVEISETLGPQIINRYNMYPSAKISGQANPGKSSGESMAIMEKIANNIIPQGMGFEWTGISFQEKAAAGQTMLVFGLSISFVYLVLCAQYESWSLPLSVIMAVPLGLLGAVAATSVRGMEINVYSQIGIILLIALICKTAILISEFAKVEQEGGTNIFDSALKAAKLRFRPIVMTALTFILGVLPLVIANGAGASGRQALGVSVFGGMITGTFLLIFFVPLFFIGTQILAEKVKSMHLIKKYNQGFPMAHKQKKHRIYSNLQK